MTDVGEFWIVGLAGEDVASWLAAYLPRHLVRHVGVDIARVEDALRTHAASWSRDAACAVAIDQRFMGFLAKRASDTLESLGHVLPPLVHPAAVVDATAQLGPGARVAAGAIVGAGVQIGAHTRVLERAVVGHGARVGSHTTLDIGTVIGARAVIGSHVWTPPGVLVEPRATVGDLCELAPGTYTGVVPAGTLHIAGLAAPARIIQFG